MSESKHIDGLDKYLADMRLLDPSYELILIDFWDPETVKNFENVTRVPGKKEAYSAQIQDFSLTYSRGSFIPVELDIKDLDTGRRLRQDGDDDLSILRLLNGLAGDTSSQPKRPRRQKKR